MRTGFCPIQCISDLRIVAGERQKGSWDKRPQNGGNRRLVQAGKAERARRMPSSRNFQFPQIGRRNKYPVSLKMALYH